MKDAKQYLGPFVIMLAATTLFVGVMYVGLSNRVKELENNNGE